MNPLLVEKAWRAAIESVIPDTVILAGSSEQQLPIGEAYIVVVLDEPVERVAGQYWKAEVVIRSAMPAMIDDPLEQQEQLFEALYAWIEDAATVAESFPAEGINLNGFFVRSAGNVIVENTWHGEIKLVAGHSRAE